MATFKHSGDDPKLAESKKQILDLVTKSLEEDPSQIAAITAVLLPGDKLFFNVAGQTHTIIEMLFTAMNRSPELYTYCLTAALMSTKKKQVSEDMLLKLYRTTA